MLLTLLLALMLGHAFLLTSFALAFFPQKTSLEGKATPRQDYPPPLPGQPTSALQRPLFKRAVLMLVDALSAELLYGEGPHSRMHFVKGLVAEGKALAFRARAHTPTVTLPRIKGLLSGSVPTFLDFVLNFQAQSFEEDNLMAQMRAAGMRVCFYGDDTWLKLFPGYFHRQDGTTSFFVSDTVEVDNNVTRHLAPELSRDDWEVLVLHYLGLDHVGHLAGPNSTLMGPKQQEMDGIVQQIHESLFPPNTPSAARDDPHFNPDETLFLLLSDHGMNNMGNHGGSSEGETSAVLVFMSSRYRHHSPPHNAAIQQVMQIDLAPSLALLLGLPIPRNSLGKLIPQLFDGFVDYEDYLAALRLNSYQHLRLLHSDRKFWGSLQTPNSEAQLFLDVLTNAEQLHNEWLQAKLLEMNDEELPSKAIEQYHEFLRRSTDQLASSLGSENVATLYLCSAILLLLSSVSLVVLVWTFFPRILEVVLQWRRQCSSALNVAVSLLLFVCSFSCFPLNFLVLGTLLHAVTLTGSLLSASWLSCLFALFFFLISLLFSF
ncbi:GPI ethanolamine phosphate transferase 2 [Balamuthia mandrillaris]